MEQLKKIIYQNTPYSVEIHSTYLKVCDILIPKYIIPKNEDNLNLFFIELCKCFYEIEGGEENFFNNLRKKGNYYKQNML